MKTNTSITMKLEVLSLLRETAKREKRSVSAQIEYIVERYFARGTPPAPAAAAPVPVTNGTAI